MPNKERALLHQTCQLNQRQTLRHLDAPRVHADQPRQPAQPLPFCLTPDQQQSRTGCLLQVLQQLGPFCFRPVLSLTAAARMKARLVERCGLRLEGQPRNVIRIENCQSLERLKIHSRSVEMTFLIRPMWPGNELPHRTTSYIDLKNLIRIVKIGDDQIELRKIIRKLFRQLAIACKESSQCPGFNGLNAIHQPSGQGQLHDVRITQDLKVRFGKLPAQSRDGWECQNEIADRSAANNQNLASHSETRTWPTQELLRTSLMRA